MLPISIANILICLAMKAANSDSKGFTHHIFLLIMVNKHLYSKKWKMKFLGLHHRWNNIAYNIQTLFKIYCVICEISMRMSNQRFPYQKVSFINPRCAIRRSNQQFQTYVTLLINGLLSALGLVCYKPKEKSSSLKKINSCYDAIHHRWR